MNDIQQKILVKLLYTKHLSFNELWNKEIASNKFAYHIKSLEQQGLIQKHDEMYTLTLQGKSYVTFINGESGKETKKPLSAVILGIFKDDKILLMKRSKEPFRDLWGLPGGKVEFNEFLSQTAHKELLEETGLTGDITFKGVKNIHTYEGEQLAFSHLLYLVRVDNPKGEVITNHREGESGWFTLNEIKKMDIIPDLLSTLKAIMHPTMAFYEGNRYMKGGECTGYEIMRKFE